MITLLGNVANLSLALFTKEMKKDASTLERENGDIFYDDNLM